MKRLLVATIVSLTLARGAYAGDLVRLVRFKISAGDLASGISAVEDFRLATGVDPEYLDAIGWLARGAELLHRNDVARRFVAELHREIPAETAALVVPYGAAMEVEGRLLASTEGRGAAIRYFENELSHANATSLQSRIRKNINLLSLEGQPAPSLDGGPTLGSLRGKPVLLFFWAAGCGDCKGQSTSLQRVWQKYKTRDLQMITATRLYGGPHDKPMSPDDERAEIATFWKETFPTMADVPTVISTETLVRYGVSATPTFALVDRKGIVRLYAPTRLSEADLSRAIDEVIADRP